MPARTALVRRPSPRLAEGLLTHVQRSPVDVGLAARQWQAYVDAVRGTGWRVVEVPPAAGCPDSAFVEDTVVVLGDLAVTTRPGAGQRRAEVAGTEEAVRAEGLEVVRLQAPGTLDGGDVLKVGSVAYRSGSRSPGVAPLRMADPPCQAGRGLLNVIDTGPGA